jgi:hypothetical protein
VFIRNRSRTSALSVDVGAAAGPFQVTGTGPYTLTALASIPITIVFTPDALGMATQSIPIMSGDPEHRNVSIALGAMVLPGRLSRPARISIAGTRGSMTSKTVLIGNAGRGILSGTVEQFPSGSAFSLVGGPVSFSLAPGKTQPLTIQFSPSSAGTVSANLTIDAGPPTASATTIVTGAAR